MRHPITLTSVCVLAFALMGGEAEAKPLHSNAAQILKVTHAAVAGTFSLDASGAAFVDIAAVLWDRGVLAGRSRIQVGHPRLDYGLDVADGVNAVFFFGTQDQLAFVAQPRVQEPIARLRLVPLELRGFYAFNAHLTTPAVVSFESIERAGRTGAFEDHFKVSVAFPAAGQLRKSSSLNFTGTLRDGRVENLSGPHKGATLTITPWEHSMALTLPGKSPLVLSGRFESVTKGVLRGRLVPSDPVVFDKKSLDAWLRTGSQALPLTLTVGKLKATLIITGKVSGKLGPGLGVEGTLARIARSDKNGYRNQYGKGAVGDHPSDGWHLEVATAKGPLWLTMPLADIDSALSPTLTEAISLQAQVLIALSSADRPITVSGALTGKGTISLDPIR